MPECYENMIMKESPTRALIICRSEGKGLIIAVTMGDNDHIKKKNLQWKLQESGQEHTKEV